MGIRRTSKCMLTPMVRLFWGSTLYIRLMMAGSDMADQEMKSTAPMSTACPAQDSQGEAGHGHQLVQNQSDIWCRQMG